MKSSPVDVACELKRKGELGDDAFARASVSRYYYAAFHAIKTSFGKTDTPLPDHKPNKVVKIFLQDSNQPNSIKRLASELDELWKNRIWADYKVGDACGQPIRDFLADTETISKKIIETVKSGLNAVSSEAVQKAKALEGLP